MKLVHTQVVVDVGVAHLNESHACLKDKYRKICLIGIHKNKHPMNTGNYILDCFNHNIFVTKSNGSESLTQFFDCSS